MLSYILRRLLLLVPTLLGVTAVVFFITAASPGGLGNIKVREGGALNQGMEAKKQLERTKRRYRLDLPAYAQYAWWLNQISPVGFEVSTHKKWEEADQAAVRAAVAKWPLAADTQASQEAQKAVLATAAYTGLAPLEAAAKFEAVLAHPDRALPLLDLMEVKPLRPEDEIKKLAAIEAEYGLAQAQTEFVAYYRGESEGRARILWGMPMPKMPDLGESMRGQSVTAQVADSLPNSILLNLLSLPIIYLVAIISGVYAARRPGGKWDLASGAFYMALWSVPALVAGCLLQTFLTNEKYARVFPTAHLHGVGAETMAFLPSYGPSGFQRGYLLDALFCMLLPVACLTYHGFATLSRIMRGSMLDSLSSDYIRTARAKGVRESDLLWRHAFRNSTLPLITMLSGLIPSLIGGAVVIETIFEIPGMGKLMVDAARNNDPDVVMASVLVGGFIAMVCDIGRDVAYAIADPRVSYE